LPFASSAQGEVADVTVHSQPRVSPEACPALVLNADFRPLSYYPLSLWAWQDSIKAVFLDRVNIVSNYEKFVRSPSFEMRLPSVVSLRRYVRPSRHPAFTRFNVFLRDRFSCQYCGSREDLTSPPVRTAICARAICAPARPACGRRGCPINQQSTICTRTAAGFRPIICTKAGWIISIGIRSWSLKCDSAVRHWSHDHHVATMQHLAIYPSAFSIARVAGLTPAKRILG
jgi:hypothetical protein